MATQERVAAGKQGTAPRRLRGPILIGLLAVALVGIFAGLIWLQPYQPSADAEAAMRDDARVTVTQRTDYISFIPNGVAPRAGLVFYPGAKVMPAAYAVYMRAIAEQGYAAFIVTLPLNLALLDVNAAAPVIAAYPQIHVWAVGGHSLGGVAASSFAASHPSVKGLLLYAAYPTGSIADAGALTVVSISGSNDGLATPAKVDAAKPLLPPQTRYVVIQGGNHSFFGDYGHQSGDGQPGVSRAQARAEIIAASLTLMREISSGQQSAPAAA